MNRIGFVLTVALAAALIALGPMPANAALPSLPGVSSGGAATQYMPKDSTIVIGVNVKSLAESGVFDTVKEMGGEELFDTFEAMSIDLTKDVSEVMLGIVIDPENPDNDPDVYVAFAGDLPSEAKFLELYEQEEGEAPESRNVEGKNVYNIDDEVDLCILPGVILLVPTEEGNADISKMLGGTQESMLSNVKLASLLKDVNTKATVWAVASLPEALRQAMADDSEEAPFDPSALETVCAAFNYGKTAVDLNVAIGFTDAETAQQLVEMFNMQIKPMGEQMAEMMPELATLINALKMEAAGTKATLTLNMDREEFEEAIEGLISTMFGAMMGGMGGEEADW